MHGTRETLVLSLGGEDSPGEGNCNRLQYSCQNNPMDRGSWWATVHAATKSWTRLSTAQHTAVAKSSCQWLSPSLCVQVCTGCCCWRMWCGHTQLCVVSRALTVRARLSSPLKKPYWEWLSVNIRLLEGLSWICSKVVKEQKINQW